MRITNKILTTLAISFLITSCNLPINQTGNYAEFHGLTKHSFPDLKISFYLPIDWRAQESKETSGVSIIVSAPNPTYNAADWQEYINCIRTAQDAVAECKEASSEWTTDAMIISISDYKIQPERLNEKINGWPAEITKLNENLLVSIQKNKQKISFTCLEQAKNSDDFTCDDFIKNLDL